MSRVIGLYLIGIHHGVHIANHGNHTVAIPESVVRIEVNIQNPVIDAEIISIIDYDILGLSMVQDIRISWTIIRGIGQIGNAIIVGVLKVTRCQSSGLESGVKYIDYLIKDSHRSICL